MKPALQSLRYERLNDTILYIVSIWEGVISMPEENNRSYNPFDNIKLPLQTKVLNITFRSAALLGIVTMLISIVLYTTTLVDQYIGMAYTAATGAGIYIQDVYDVESMMDEVMDVYRGMSDEERAAVDTEEYKERFSHIAKTGEYRKLRQTLTDVYGESAIDDVYIGWYDKETSALIYLCDPYSESWESYDVGYWEPVEMKEVDKFLNRAGEYRLHDTSWTRRYGWICTSGYPIFDEESNPVAFVLADVRLSNLASSLLRFILLFMLTTILVITFIANRLSEYMDRTLVTPIKSIANAAQNYSLEREEGGSSTGYFDNLNISTGDEVEALGNVMARMETSLTDYEQSLEAITAERERVLTEMSLATRIQADMLPNVFPAFPERTEFDIHASMEPAKQIGGDFYNFFLIDDDHLCLMMADVSGKGIPAALFMMSSMILISDQAILGLSPAEILRRVNELICANNREEMFVTVWLGILELSTGKVTAANAGHEFPIISDSNGNFDLFKDPHGFVIGGMEGMKYKEYEFTMEHGSRLFLYTDGVTEATDSDNGLFGTERLLDVLNLAADADPEETLYMVRNTIEAFVGDAEQFDDLTMMCVRYN